MVAPKTQEDTRNFYQECFARQFQSIEEYINERVAPIGVLKPDQDQATDSQPTETKYIVYAPISGLDPAEVQIQDMEEKIKVLIQQIENYRENKDGKSRTEVIYRRLSEACVKYSMQLDRVNIIGRDDLRETRKKMLIKLDQMSTELVIIQNE